MSLEWDWQPEENSWGEGGSKERWVAAVALPQEDQGKRQSLAAAVPRKQGVPGLGGHAHSTVLGSPHSDSKHLKGWTRAGSSHFPKAGFFFLFWMQNSYDFI